MEKLFALKQNYKDECNDFMQGFVKLIMNSLPGVQKRKHVDEFFSM